MKSSAVAPFLFGMVSIQVRDPLIQELRDFSSKHPQVAQDRDVLITQSHLIETLDARLAVHPELASVLFRKGSHVYFSGRSMSLVIHPGEKNKRVWGYFAYSTGNKRHYFYLDDNSLRRIRFKKQEDYPSNFEELDAIVTKATQDKLLRQLHPAVTTRVSTPNELVENVLIDLVKDHA